MSPFLLKLMLILVLSQVSAVKQAHSQATAVVRDPTQIKAPSELSYDFLGSAIRKKKLFLITVDVYELSVFVPKSYAIERTMEKSWDSLANTPYFKLNLKFLRDVNTDRAKQSFHESFVKNNIDDSLPHLQKFLKAIDDSGDFTKNEVIEIIGVKPSKPSGYETISFGRKSLQEPVIIEGPTGFHKDFLAVWFGKSADRGVDYVKKGILGIK